MMPTKRNCRVSIKKEVIKKSMVTKLKLVLLVLGLGGCTSKSEWTVWLEDLEKRQEEKEREEWRTGEEEISE